MADRLVRSRFRALTPNGRLWWESDDPDEVLRHSADVDVELERYDVYERTDGWKPWHTGRH